MNKFLLLLIPFLFIPVSNEKLSGNDYPLTIKPGKVIKDDGITILEIPVTLTNKTKEKLSYGSMSCSWQNFYHHVNKDLLIEGTDCDKNVPIAVEVAPSESKTVLLRLHVKNPSAKKSETFKIGLNLIPVNTEKQLEQFYDSRIPEKSKGSMIWSNQITMKI
ncbi:MAG: hypothetical protein DI539_01875 [Flavobacterium psychrophilum]|nr:MAG: hypothetical protein DI539_01875 [Flavobacterium psychrophilum]